MKIEVIRVAGAAEQHELCGRSRNVLDQIATLIQAAEGLDIVNLRDGRVMFVDDTGVIDGRPVNAEATKLYHGVCRPGTTHQICGDVAIGLDADFA